MASSDFTIPTTLTTKSVIIDTSSAVDSSALMYKSGSGKFVATEVSPPVGIIRMYPSNSAPTNYIICNGQSLNTYTYRVLHKVISNKYGGTAYSAGVTDQSGAATTFTLPNFSGSYVAYGSNSNTSLPNAIGTGTTVDISHSHVFPITFTAGSGNTDHSHNSPTINTELANHGHYWSGANTQVGGSHTHTINSNSTQHDHNFLRSSTSGSGSTSGPSGNHSHNLTAPGANHNHTANSNDDAHTHSTGNATFTQGGSHSTHNFTMTTNAHTLTHSHTHNSATGIYFYIRYQ